MGNEMIERVAKAVREEVVRQYRDDERRKCPAGSSYYEEHISPALVASAALSAMREPTEHVVGTPWAEEILLPDGTVVQDELALAIWQSMIDAALA